MISGAHMVIYSSDAEADRAFFRDVLGLPSVDAGQGWLIFALPPAEIAFHPAAESGKHEIYLTCDDVAATIQSLEKQKVVCEPLADLGWGLLTHLMLPGGGRLGLYQPKHPIAARKRRAKPDPKND
jgi:catechol 2,3-dioxygenase-like lactoylglutathione lyase family enzyme